MTLAKGLGSGLPIGASWSQAEASWKVEARRARQHLRRQSALLRRRAGDASIWWSANTPPTPPKVGAYFIGALRELQAGFDVYR